MGRESTRNEWRGSLLTLRSGCCRQKLRRDEVRYCRWSHKPAKAERATRSCDPSWEERIREGKRTLIFCRMQDLNFESFWLQSHFGFYCLCDGEKAAKVGHLAQGKRSPPLWSSGGNYGAAAFKKRRKKKGERPRRTRVTWVGVDDTTASPNVKDLFHSALYCTHQALEREGILHNQSANLLEIKFKNPLGI